MLCDVERTEAYRSVELFISIYYHHSNQRSISLSNYIYRYLCIIGASCSRLFSVYAGDDCGVIKGEAEADVRTIEMLE